MMNFLNNLKKEVPIRMFKNWFKSLLNRATAIFIGHFVFIGGKICHFFGAKSIRRPKYALKQGLMP